MISSFPNVLLNRYGSIVDIRKGTNICVIWLINGIIHVCTSESHQFLGIVCEIAALEMTIELLKTFVFPSFKTGVTKIRTDCDDNELNGDGTPRSIIME